MQLTIFSGGIIILVFFLLLKRIFSGSELVKRNNVKLEGFLFGGCFLLLAFHFYERRQNAGLLAVGMGATAISKYLYDKSENSEEN